jgi:hypothetical protein
VGRALAISSEVRGTSLIASALNGVVTFNVITDLIHRTGFAHPSLVISGPQRSGTVHNAIVGVRSESAACGPQGFSAPNSGAFPRLPNDFSDLHPVLRAKEDWCRTL